MTLPTNWTSGQQFTAANENSVDAAINALQLEPTTVKTGAYNAVVGNFVPCDATSAGFTVTLPSAPADQSLVEVFKIDSTTNAVTVACGGSDVFDKASGATTRTLSLQFQSTRLQYYSVTGIWYELADNLPLSALDARYQSAVSGSIVPSAGNTYNLGSVSDYFATTYTNALAFEGSSPTVTGLSSSTLAVSNLFEGFTTQAASGTTLALTVASTEIQAITGTTQTQLVTLPTTSVPAGASWTVLNQTTGALVTVQSSGGNTVAILPAGTGGTFYALVATPTTAANWNYRESGQLEQLGLATTPTAAGTTTLTAFSADTQIFTGSTTQTVVLPTTGVPAGADYTIINQSTGVVTVQSSGANTVALLAAGASGLFVAAVATPTTAANWIYLEQGELQQLGNTNISAAAGTTTLTPFSTGNIIVTGSTTQTIQLPTGAGVYAGAQYQIINQSTGAVQIQSSGANNILSLPGAATAPYACATFTAVVASPTTAANWDYSGQGAANANLGTPAAGVLTNCTGLPLAGLAAAAYNTGANASTLAERDSNANLTANAFLPASNSTVTAAGTTTLTVSSATVQVFTGSTTQTVKLPTTGVPVGAQYTVINQSSGTVSVQSSSAAAVTTVAGGAITVFIAGVATPTTAANWNFYTTTVG